MLERTRSATGRGFESFSRAFSSPKALARHSRGWLLRLGSILALSYFVMECSGRRIKSRKGVDPFQERRGAAGCHEHIGDQRALVKKSKGK